MFTCGCHYLALPYLVDWLDVSAGPVGITTTSAFPHRGNLHDEKKAVAKAVV